MSSDSRKEQLLKEFDSEVLRFQQTTLFKSMGFSGDEVKRPRICIVNSWSEQTPGHVHLRELSEAAKAGIRYAGGMPYETNVIAPCAAFSNSTYENVHFDFPTRDVILASIETALRQSYCDGWIGFASCDKIVPAMLMAAVRLNRPCIIIPGGSMLPGHYRGEWLTVGSGVNKYFEKYPHGCSDENDFEKLTSACGYCAGTCSEMTTGSTMQVLTEALGMALPYASTTPAVIAEIRHRAQEAGGKIVEIAQKHIRPSDIITKKSLQNALMVDMAVCGSANTIVHFQAIAHEAGIDLSYADWQEASNRVKAICTTAPTGDHTVCDLHYAGGIPAVMKEIADDLNLDCLTVNGRTVGENIADARVLDRDVNHERANPVSDMGAIRILYGNLAPDGAVCRQSVITDRDLLVHDFKARVYDNHQDAMVDILEGHIDDGDAIVLRYEGPRGGPAMTELYYIVTAIKKMRLHNKKIAVITDGRFSGFTSRMVAIGHVAPEAYVGGPLAYVRENDTIHIDIPNGVLDLMIDEKEWEQRKKNWTIPKEKAEVTPPGILNVYRKMALQAPDGAGWELK